MIITQNAVPLVSRSSTNSNAPSGKISAELGGWYFSLPLRIEHLDLNSTEVAHSRARAERASGFLLGGCDLSLFSFLHFCGGCGTTD